jgi:hypothetical protein
MIPYLVMLAIEAVENAMAHSTVPHGHWPGVFRRLQRAGVEGLIVLSTCIALGLWVSRELRRPPSVPGAPDTAHRGSWILGILSLVTALGAVRMLTVTIPTWQRLMADGLQIFLAPEVRTSIIVGFAGLAAGIAARAADLPVAPPPREESARWRPVWRGLGYVLKAGVALTLIDVVLARVFYHAIAEQTTNTGVIGWADVAFSRLRSSIPFASSIGWMESPEILALLAAQLWIGLRILLLLSRPVSLDPTPIDATLENRAAFVRFVLRSLALVVLMVAALPVLFIEGIALCHLILHPF